MGKRGKGRMKKKGLDRDLDRELDEYEPSESEDEFGKDEKILLDKRKGTRIEESEEEVFGIHSSDDEEEEETGAGQFSGGAVGSDMDSDIEGKGSDADSEAGLPDAKAWGRKSKKFYHTDYVDKDFGGVLSREDEEMAEMEEQEAANIQRRLMSQMEEGDFTLGLLNKVEEKKSELTKKVEDFDEGEKIVSDLSKLSSSEKIRLLKQESPELFKLIDDFKENMGLAQEKLLPIINLVKSGRLDSCPATDFVQTLFSIILNYSMNIVFYLLLKSKRCPSVDEHPVIHRLFTYKKVADEMLISFDDKLIDQIERIIVSNNKGLLPLASSTDRSVGKVKQLKVSEDAENIGKLIEKKKKRLEAKKGEEIIEDILSDEDDRDQLFDDEPMEEEEDTEVDPEMKRAITYEMKKNKGLTPRRKKEDRNPRVKNRMKYRKAMIRRKGQVRQVRSETSRYGGEMSGIKSYTSKSIKLKV